MEDARGRLHEVVHPSRGGQLGVVGRQGPAHHHGEVGHARGNGHVGQALALDHGRGQAALVVETEDPVEGGLAQVTVHE